MHRTQLINHICNKIKAKTYLEIGVDDGVNFNNIQCDYKVGVDPNPYCKYATYHITSDDYFQFHNEKFDLVFIDGLHHYDQVYKDIENSLKILNDGGVIVCHDMNPSTELMQKVPRESTEWTGDCWKAWVKLRNNPSLTMRTVNTDYGCGVIQRGYGILLEINEELTWDNLNNNRESWLNLVSIETFLSEDL